MKIMYSSLAPAIKVITTMYDKTSAVFVPIFQVLHATALFWVPLVLAGIFMKVWFNYIRTDFFTNQGYFFMEVKLPREIEKTPLAMEVFLTAIWQKPTSTYIEAYWLGKVQPWFSLELVSIGGQVKFFIWGPKKYKNIVESQLYAQYPNVEIYEAADYTTMITHDLSKTFMWGCYFKLGGKDVYPIKTYVDYGIDREIVEEEQKVDPMTAVIEYLGSIKPTDQVWIQILIMGHQSRGIAQGHLFRTKDWTMEAKKEIAAIRKGAAFGETGFPLMTKGQQDTILAIERSIGKYAYDTFMRCFYICPADTLDEAAIPGLIGSVKQYNSNNLNGFKLGWFTDFDYPWMDFRRIRRTRFEKQMLKAYKMRSAFHIPYRNFHGRPFILTTEELATIYHFPGSVARTPNLARIESRRSEPPSNLPV